MKPARRLVFVVSLWLVDAALTVLESIQRRRAGASTPGP